MEKFEYKIYQPEMKRGFLSKSLSPDDIQRELDRFGAEGWELTSTVPVSGNAMVASYGSSTVSVMFIFKRKTHGF